MKIKGSSETDHQTGSTDSSVKRSSTCMRKSALSIPVTCAILLVLMTLIPMGSAIRCYVCQSKYNPECADDLPANPSPDHRAYKFLVNCSTMNEPSGPLTLCRKQDQEVEGSRNVIRSCGAIKAEKDCYQASNPPTKSIVCQCFEDGCNSATGVTSSFLLISLLFSILLLFGLPK